MGCPLTHHAPLTLVGGSNKNSWAATVTATRLAVKLWQSVDNRLAVCHFIAVPRTIRIEFAGAFHCAMSRGNRRADIFLDDEGRQNLLKTLGEAFQKAEFQFHAIPVAVGGGIWRRRSIGPGGSGWTVCWASTGLGRIPIPQPAGRNWRGGRSVGHRRAVGPSAAPLRRTRYLGGQAFKGGLPTGLEWVVGRAPVPNVMSGRGPTITIMHKNPSYG